MKFINRRSLLRGAGGIAIPLPLLDIMGSPTLARADAPIQKTGPNGAPKRFIVFFTGAGQGADFLKSSNDATGKLVLPPALAPLKKHSEKLLILDGLNNQSALHEYSNIDPGHLKPFLNLLACVPSSNGLAGGTTIDQAIAKEVSAGTRLPSIELGVNPLGASLGTLSYAKGGNPLPAIGKLQQAFTKLFSETPAAPKTIDRVLEDRKSILDDVKNDYGTFISKLGGDDKRRVEAHLDTIREIESRLGMVGATSGAACKTPPAPGENPKSDDWLKIIGDTQSSLIATAFACDVTRVGSILWEGAGSGITPPGFPMTMHDASHVYGSGGWPLRNKFTSWLAERVAYLLDRLSEAKEGDSTVLDNSIVYWCSEHGCGNHNYDWMPTLVAGSAGGYFKTGRNVRFPNKTTGVDFVNASAGAGDATGPSQADLFVSFLNAMGSPAKSFGVPSQCKGPLPGLTA